ncbi:30S ribosomal protein S17 [Candidatus Dojkabacteria bacterium]|uniref:Small ribosomal subunit protein uS17 n=1 Tax=Candidatus Dojkabacteria bacterium TaxID=2099670 RepID=A0A955RMF4_9BACT|nr:30S ribosomal protein S17 [Candidatus Dojkabacteria bacterium]
MAKTNTKQTKTEEKNTLRRIMDGVVVSISDPKTAKVKIETKFPHPKYGKIIKSHKSYLAHISEGLEVQAGDMVSIGEIRPLSKNKTWEIINKVEDKK